MSTRMLGQVSAAKGGMLPRLIAGLLLASILSGCVVVPAYPPPPPRYHYYYAYPPYYY